MQIVKSDLQINQGLPINQHKDQTKSVLAISDILNDACILYFGVHTSQISDVVIKKAITEILKRFSHLSLEEIKYSFERIKLDRLVTVVLDDLIKPVQKYVNVKEQINKERIRLQKELNEQSEAEIKIQEFQNEAINLYNDSLKTGEWLGTIFHCKFLAEKYLTDKFTKEEKQKFVDEAKTKVIHTSDPSVFLQNFGRCFSLEKNESVEDRKTKYQIVLKRLICECAVKEAVKLKIEI